MNVSQMSDNLKLPSENKNFVMLPDKIPPCRTSKIAWGTNEIRNKDTEKKVVFNDGRFFRCQNAKMATAGM